MKNTFLVLALTVLLTSTGNICKAQKGVMMTPNAFGSATNDEGYAGTMSPENNEATNAVDIKARENFKKNFPSVVNANWYTNNEGYFIASFKDETTQKRVIYDKKGRWHHTISYYNEKALPEDIWHVVKSTYYAYDILNVIEVQVGDQTVYILTLQNEKFLKTVRLHNGELEEVQHLKRGD